jgi:Ca-activated chloride channel family protein
MSPLPKCSEMRRPFKAAAVTVLLLASTASAQTTPPRPPTFEVGIDVVTLNVSVRDGRHFVGELGQADFAVYEDGVQQALSLYVHGQLPISLALMIDTSASMSEKLPVAQKAASRFLGTLLPGDRAQVIAFSDRIVTLADFGAGQPALESAVASTAASGATALHNAVYVALKGLAGQRTPGELRRRAIVLLSDGEDTSSLVTDEQVIELARRSEVVIYAVSLRPNRSLDRMQRNFSQAAYLLTTLAQESGGRVYFPNSLEELDEVYGRIAEELRALYTMGYVSANKKRDGKWRRIVVRVPSREGVEVRHKIGYVGPRG